MTETEAWVTVAERVDNGQNDFICHAITALTRSSGISPRQRNSMHAKVRRDLDGHNICDSCIPWEDRASVIPLRTTRVLYCLIQAARISR